MNSSQLDIEESVNNIDRQSLPPQRGTGNRNIINIESYDPIGIFDRQSVGSGQFRRADETDIKELYKVISTYFYNVRREFNSI